jgi:hypothetical protein
MAQIKTKVRMPVEARSQLLLVRAKILCLIDVLTLQDAAITNENVRLILMKVTEDLAQMSEGIVLKNESTKESVPDDVREKLAELLKIIWRGDEQNAKALKQEADQIL